MKSIITLIIFFAILTSSGEAQIIRSYGLKVGTIAASQFFDYNINVTNPTTTRWGFDGGGFVEFLNVPYFSLLAELSYVQRGYSSTLKVSTPAQPQGTGEYVTIRPRVDYVSLPLMAKVRFEAEEVIPYFMVGPRFDFLLGTNNSSLDYSPTDIGMTFGAGAQLSFFSPTQFLVEGRFSPSFTKAFEGRYLTVKNNSFEILIGMTL